MLHLIILCYILRLISSHLRFTIPTTFISLYCSRVRKHHGCIDKSENREEAADGVEVEKHSMTSTRRKQASTRCLVRPSVGGSKTGSRDGRPDPRAQSTRAGWPPSRTGTRSPTAGCFYPPIVTPSFATISCMHPAGV